MNNRVGVYERDVWIVRYLLDAPADKRTIRDIWEAAKQPPHSVDVEGVVQPGGLGDPASLPTYHRTVGKLVARGTLIMDGGDTGTARYAVASNVSPLTPLSQSDLNEALWDLGPTQAMAYYVDAVEHFESKAAAVMRRAAEALLEEDPRDLILRMLQDSSQRLDEDIADALDDDTSDAAHRATVDRRLSDFGRFVHGELGLNPSVWAIPDLQECDRSKESDSWVNLSDWSAVRDELAQHVYGSRFLRVLDAESDPSNDANLIVAGTDGSSHPGDVRGMPAAAYNDEDRLTLWFNNSAGFVDLPATYPERFPSPYHGIPVTRAALEDPSNKGMIISRPWFQDLDDGEFEHLKKTALDVVQYRIDEALLSGMALPYGAHPVKGGPALPKPHVLLRDGSVSPQGRELQNYTNRTSYGEMVREGIRLSYKILRHVMDSDRRVFAGAVKSTQLRTFSRILNWYIQRGSASRFGQAIDPQWDLARMGLISDSVAMTRLLGALPKLARKSQYYGTCVIVRPFPAMISGLFRARDVEKPEDWYEHFEKLLTRSQDHHRKQGGERPWFEGRDLREDEYVRMCVYGDYGMFYFGLPGGSPQIRFPRFEFLDSIRKLRPEDRETRVLRAVQLIVSSVHRSKWALDRDHNMMTAHRLPRLVPFVVYEAHEKCKVLGHKLISELQQAIAASLSEMKAVRGLAVPRIAIEPVSRRRFQRYLERMKRGIAGRGERVGDADVLPASMALEGSAQQKDDVPSDDFGETAGKGVTD